MYVDTSNKYQRKAKEQSRMDNPKTQATLDKQTQATLNRQTQATLDRQTQATLDRQTQETLDKQTQATLDKQTQATLDKQTQDETKLKNTTQHRNLKRLATQTHQKPR